MSRELEIEFGNSPLNTPHPYANKLIVAVDGNFKQFTSISEAHEYATRLLGDTIEQLQGLGVQLKLDTVARFLGYIKAISDIQDAGLNAMIDMKLIDTINTMLEDIAVLRLFRAVRRITFRIETHKDFLAMAMELVSHAIATNPGVSLLPVGPLTDNDDAYFQQRGFTGREEAVRTFAWQVADIFGDNVTEVIISPKDIHLVHNGFFGPHRAPVTPGVRPFGLKGNDGNNVNALDVRAAIRAGASGLIVGNPIMQADNPRDATIMVLDQIGEELEAPRS